LGGFWSKRLVELVQVAANLVTGMRRQPGKLKRGDASAVVDSHDNRFSVNARGNIQDKGKGHLLRVPERHHGAERETMLREVAHHSTVGRRKFHVDEAQRPFSVLRPALGFQSHGSSVEGILTPKTVFGRAVVGQ
jgi:hypothetical protein